MDLLASIPYSDISWLNPLVEALVNRDPRLESLLNRHASIQAFGQQMEQRHFSSERRRKLFDVIMGQMEKRQSGDLQKMHCHSLKLEKTFTVCTAHQPNLFLGPLYTIYKAVSCIALCRELKKHFPSNNFVPIFWLNGEDDDWEELQNCNFQDSTLHWQDNERKMVGRKNPNSYVGLLDRLSQMDSQNKLHDILYFFKNQIERVDNQSEFVAASLDFLFKDFGMLVLRQDDPQLKEMAGSLWEKEWKQPFIKKGVGEANRLLETQNWKPQARAKEINLFHLQDDNSRRSPEMEDPKPNNAHIGTTALSRTLFQELVLPNLAYVGGGGELSYWLQCKPCFDRMQIPFPILIPRCSFVLLKKGTKERMSQNELQVDDLLSDLDNYVMRLFNAENLDLENSRKRLNQLFKELFEKTKHLDTSLEQGIMADFKSAEKALDKVKKRIRKAVRQKNQKGIELIQEIQKWILPGGEKQERSRSIFDILEHHEGKLIPQLLEHAQPMGFSLKVLELDGHGDDA